MVKKNEARLKNEAFLKNNFLKYCHCIDVVCKKILANLHKWFYKGGDANYLDYLLSVYDISDIEGPINSNHRKALRQKTAFELDIPLLHTLMQLSCSYYDEIERDKHCDEGFKTLRDGVEKIVIAYMNLGNLKPRLTDPDLQEKLNEISELSEKLINEGKRLSDVDPYVHKAVHDDACFGIMCLNSNLHIYYFSFPRGLEDVSWARLQRRKEDADREIASRVKPKKKDSDTCYKEILEHKNIVANINNRRAQRLKGSDGNGREAQGAEALPLHLPDNVEQEEKNKKKVIRSKKGARKVLTAKRGSPTADEKSTSDESVSESSTTAAASSKLQARIRAALTPIKSNLTQVSLEGSLPSYADKDIFLKQHQKYSQKAGQLVQLEDLLTVKGMNSDVAEIIIMSGGPGTGKSMLLGYISEKWNNDQSAVNQLCTRDFLLSSDLKSNTCNTFTALILDSMKEKVDQDIEDDILRKMVLEFSLLVTLDAYDESSEESLQLVKDVLEMRGTDLRVIITCRPQYVDSLYRQIPSSRRKHVSHLCLNGILSTHHADFVSRLIDGQRSGEPYSDNCQQDKIKEGLIKRLPEIYDAFGDELCNPLLLKIITTMWTENPRIELQ